MYCTAMRHGSVNIFFSKKHVLLYYNSLQVEENQQKQARLKNVVTLRTLIENKMVVTILFCICHIE